jgi:hypothetical protein
MCIPEDVRRLPGPAAQACVRRNSGRDPARRVRWRGARRSLWRLLDAHVSPGDRVAVIGTGHGDDLPLRRLTGRAGQVTLFDVDAAALLAARRRCPRRHRVETVAHDLTAGAADAAARLALEGSTSATLGLCTDPLPGAPYDVVVADLLYTQLLFPALQDARLGGGVVSAALTRYGQALTGAAVASLHASAPAGCVVHVHDEVGWWPGREQPETLDALLGAAARDPGGMNARLERMRRPLGCDVAAELDRIGARTIERRWWRWPFAPGTDYLVSATVAAPADHITRSSSAASASSARPMSATTARGMR